VTFGSPGQYHNFPKIYWGLYYGYIKTKSVDFTKDINPKTGKRLIETFPQYYQRRVDVILKKKDEERKRREVVVVKNKIEKSPEKFRPDNLEPIKR
jgi:hypothetical protein